MNANLHLESRFELRYGAQDSMQPHYITTMTMAVAQAIKPQLYLHRANNR